MPASEGDIALLRDIVQRHCIQYGDFTLASGRSSSYYYNGKLATLHPPTASLIGEILVDLIIDSGAEAVGGPAVGAIPIACAVGRASLDRKRFLPVFIVRMEQKQHGAKERIAESLTLEGGATLITPGRRVAIVEDAITTGGSVKKAIDAVEELKAEVTLIAVLVERHEGGGDLLRDSGYDVLSLFRTNEEGVLSVNQDFLRRIEAVGVTNG